MDRDYLTDNDLRLAAIFAAEDACKTLSEGDNFAIKRALQRLQMAAFYLKNTAAYAAQEHKEEA